MSDHPNGKLVLVVDDELEILKLVFASLEREGYTVIGARNGRSALSAARQVQPAAILMDVRMPGMDGFETSKRLKEDPATQQIPILVVSASADHEDQDRARDAGCDDWLSKPFDYGELSRRIGALTASAS